MNPKSLFGISGLVLEADTGMPLKGLTVRWLSPEGKPDTRFDPATLEADGKFSVRAALRYNVLLEREKPRVLLMVYGPGDKALLAKPVGSSYLLGKPRDLSIHVPAESISPEFAAFLKVYPAIRSRIKSDPMFGPKYFVDPVRACTDGGIGLEARAVTFLKKMGGSSNSEVYDVLAREKRFHIFRNIQFS